MTDTFTNRQKDFANFVINYNKLSLLNIKNAFLGDLLTNEYFTTNDNNTYQFVQKTNDILSNILSFNKRPIDNTRPSAFKINTTSTNVNGVSNYTNLNAILSAETGSGVHSNYVNFSELGSTSTYVNVIGINLINCLDTITDSYISNIKTLATSPSQNTPPNVNMNGGVLSDILLGLYGWYQILDTVNWQNFQQGNGININNILYDNQKVNIPFIIYKKYEDIDKYSNQWTMLPNLSVTGCKYLWNAMNGIIPINSILEYVNNQDKYGYFDIYVMRRLIYSYISIINFDIGLQIYSYMYTSTTYDSTSTQDLLIRNLINILTFQNNRIEYSNTALDNINTDSNNSLILYNKHLIELKKISDKVQANKNILLDYKTQYSKNTAISKTIIIYEILVAVLLSIVGIMSSIIIIFGDTMDYNTKLIISLTELIIVLIGIVIIIIMYNRSFSVKVVNEQFTTRFNMFAQQAAAIAAMTARPTFNIPQSTPGIGTSPGTIQTPAIGTSPAPIPIPTVSSSLETLRTGADTTSTTSTTSSTGLSVPSSQININALSNYNIPLTSNTLDRVDIYVNNMILEINRFLALTDNINNTLKMNKIFGDLSYSTLQELEYYTNINEQLINSIEKIKSAVNLTRLNSITHKYRLFLLLALSFILSISTYLSLYIISPIIFITADVLSILAFIVYLMFVSFNVRTDTNKFYWTTSIKNLEKRMN